MEKTLERVLDLVIYQISGKEYCADAKKVIAVLKPEELSYIPTTKEGKPSHLLVRDDMEFLVIKMENFVNAHKDIDSDETRIILLEPNGQRLLFFVDRVIEIISIDPNFASKTMQFFNNETENFIEGMIKYEGREFILPDYKEISMYVKQNS